MSGLKGTNTEILVHFLNENCYQTNNRFHQENFKKFKLKYKFYIGENYVRS